jgi:hypothetical protein
MLYEYMYCLGFYTNVCVCVRERERERVHTHTHTHLYKTLQYIYVLLGFRVQGLVYLSNRNG